MSVKASEHQLPTHSHQHFSWKKRGEPISGAFFPQEREEFDEFFLNLNLQNHQDAVTYKRVKRPASWLRLEWPRGMTPSKTQSLTGCTCWCLLKFPSYPAPCDLNMASAISTETTVAHKKLRAGGRDVWKIAEHSQAVPPPLLSSVNSTPRGPWGGESTVRKHLWIPCSTPLMATFHPFLFYKRFHLLHLWPQGLDKWMEAWCGFSALGCVPCTN